LSLKCLSTNPFEHIGEIWIGAGHWMLYTFCYVHNGCSATACLCQVFLDCYHWWWDSWSWVNNV